MGKKVKKVPLKRQFSVYLDSDLCEIIERVADNQERSTNQVIERWLKHGIGNGFEPAKLTREIK